MAAFLSRRLAQLVPTLFFVSVIIFLLQQLLPGDPALVMAGEERDPAVLEQIRKQYRLDQPLPMQYLHWVKGVLTGDLGESMRIKRPVSDLVLEKLPVTLQLASMAFVIALLIGIPAGFPAPAASVHPGAARRGAGPRAGRPGAPHRPRRRRAEPARAAARLPLPHALPARDRAVQHRGAGTGADARRRHGRLPPLARDRRRGDRRRAPAPENPVLARLQAAFTRVNDGARDARL